MFRRPMTKDELLTGAKEKLSEALAMIARQDIHRAERLAREAWLLLEELTHAR